MHMCAEKTIIVQSVPRHLSWNRPWENTFSELTVIVRSVPSATRRLNVRPHYRSIRSFIWSLLMYAPVARPSFGVMDFVLMKKCNKYIENLTLYRNCYHVHKLYRFNRLRLYFIFHREIIYENTVPTLYCRDSSPSRRLKFVIVLIVRKAENLWELMREGSTIMRKRREYSEFCHSI